MNIKIKHIFFFVVLFATSTYRSYSQKFTTTLGESNSVTSTTSTNDGQVIVQDYVLPIQGSPFYSDNTESNKYLYTFFPDFPLTLGRGIDPNKLQETKFSPLSEIVKDTVDGIRPLSTTADVYLVSNKDELRKVFDLDVKMSVRYLGFKGNSSLNIVNTYNFDQNNIMIVIKGQSEFSRIALRNPQLSEDAKKILSRKGGYNEFVRLYGSNIVSVERRGVSVYFLITINNVTSSMKNSINASLDAGGSFGPVGGKLEMKLRQEISQKSEKEDLNIRFISFGGDGLSDFASIVAKLKTKGNTFEDIKQELSYTLKNYSTFDKSIPIGYLVTPVTNIPSVYIAKYEDLYSSIQEKYLAAVSEKYFDNLNNLTVFQEVINQTHPLSWYASPEDLDKISKALPVQKEYVERLRALHDTILNHFNFFRNKPESEIQKRLVYVNPTGKPLLDEANKIIESKYFTITSTSDKFKFSGYGIKGLNYYLQGETSDYTQSETPAGIEFRKSIKIFEITTMTPIGYIIQPEIMGTLKEFEIDKSALTMTPIGSIIQSEIMGTINEFEIDKSALKKNLESGAMGLKTNSTDFANDSKDFKYFSITCIVTSVFGKQIRIPIGYMLYNPNKDAYQAYLRPELNYQTTSFINHN